MVLHRVYWTKQKTQKKKKWVRGEPSCPDQFDDSSTLKSSRLTLWEHGKRLGTDISCHLGKLDAHRDVNVEERSAC
jgi:hypothetical protein